MRPKRISMGCYMVASPDGKQVVLQRVGRRGFKIVQRPGAIAPTIKRLRDAARIAIENLSPWPFTVPMEPND